MDDLDRSYSVSTSSRLFPVGLKGEIEKPPVTSSQRISTKDTAKSIALPGSKKKLWGSLPCWIVQKQELLFPVPKQGDRWGQGQYYAKLSLLAPLSPAMPLHQLKIDAASLQSSILMDGHQQAWWRAVTKVNSRCFQSCLEEQTPSKQGCGHTCSVLLQILVFRHKYL